MFSKLLKGYSYHKFTEDWFFFARNGGAAVGAIGWLASDHRGCTSLSEHIIGGAFFTGVGMLTGIGALGLHPIMVAGVVVGVPAYYVDRLRNSGVYGRSV
jgi:hypothetical protein